MCTEREDPDARLTFPPVGLGPISVPPWKRARAKDARRMLGSRDTVFWGGEILGLVITGSSPLGKTTKPPKAQLPSLEDKPCLPCRKSASGRASKVLFARLHSALRLFIPPGGHLLVHPIQSSKPFAR